MYNFIFYFMYKFKERKTGDSSDARFTASLAVVITLMFHLFLIVSSIRYFFEYKTKLLQFTNNKQVDRLIITGFGIVLILIGCLFFSKKRASRITAYFDNKAGNIFSIKNIVIFLMITLLPLVIGIYLLNNSAMVLDHGSK